MMSTFTVKVKTFFPEIIPGKKSLNMRKTRKETLDTFLKEFLVLFSYEFMVNYIGKFDEGPQLHFERFLV